MNKSESKYFNTAMRMDKAFLELIEIKDFEYMTIKEICQKAEVNRSTFYLHYENMNDLLIESVEYMHRQFQSYFNEQVFDIESLSIQELIFITPEYLVPYLTFIKDNRRLFQTVIQKGMTFNVNETYEKMFQHIFNPIMNKMNFPMNERHYILSFYIHGIIAIVNKWIQNDCLDSIEDIVNTIIKCVHSFHSYHAIK